MFHPVGSQPPSVYWRRRLVLLAFVAAVIVLVALTAHALASGGGPGGSSAAAVPGTQQRTTAPPTHHSAPRRTSAPPSTSASSTSPSSSPAAPTPCRAGKLTVAAVTDQHSYPVGAQPVLMIQVTNRGPDPCVQDLADRQIVLRVYNGESRVWGSHDCQIQPGTDDRTLEVGQPVRRSIVWSGLSSQPKCAGIRQRVGAGTYTLYASLSGKTGTATQFTIS